MHFPLLKPIHGWRAFAGEVGIIVVGVLIALTAGEIVQTLNWRAQVSEARVAMDAQLAGSDYAALERIASTQPSSPAAAKDPKGSSGGCFSVIYVRLTRC